MHRALSHGAFYPTLHCGDLILLNHPELEPFKPPCGNDAMCVCGEKGARVVCAFAVSAELFHLFIFRFAEEKNCKMRDSHQRAETGERKPTLTNTNTLWAQTHTHTHIYTQTPTQICTNLE